MYHPRKYKPTFVVNRNALYEYFKQHGIDPIEVRPNPEKPWLKQYIYKNSRKLGATLARYIEHDCYTARQKREEADNKQQSIE